MVQRQDCVHELEQAVEVERLFEERGRADVGGPRLVESGQDDHGHLRQRAIGLLLAAEFPAIHHRHHQVEQDDVRFVALGEVFEGFAPVGDGRWLETLRASAAAPSSRVDRRHLRRSGSGSVPQREMPSNSLDA